MKITTDPKTKKTLIRKALEEKMKNTWGCFKKDPKKSENCRKLLLFLIKTKIAFPEYKRKNPKITRKQMEELWNSTESVVNPTEKTRSPSRSNSGNSGLLTCPNCKSDDIVFQGFDGSTAICQNCGVSWQILGGKNEVFVAHSSVNQFPTIQAYVDSKGNEIDPEFPRIFAQSDSKEKYLQKSIKELYEILKSYSREWTISTWSTFVQRAVFYWVKYLESIPPGSGMPKKIKRMPTLPTKQSNSQRDKQNMKSRNLLRNRQRRRPRTRSTRSPRRRSQGCNPPNELWKANIRRHADTI